MKKNEVQVGGEYVAKVSGKLVRVRIDAENPNGGWDATNVGTKRKIRIRSAARLRPDTKTDEQDPDTCATAGCAQPTALIYLGRPRCQACYADEAGDADQTPPDAEPVIDINAEAEAPPSAKSKRAKTNATTPKPPTAAKARKKAAKRTTPAKAAKPPTQAKRSRRERQPEADAASTPMTALQAAAEVLRGSDEPMNCVSLVAAMAERGLWTSPGGKTPHATLHAAITREIKTQGRDGRFRKAGPGKFAFNTGSAA